MAVRLLRLFELDLLAVTKDAIRCS